MLKSDGLKRAFKTVLRRCDLESNRRVCIRFIGRLLSKYFRNLDDDFVGRVFKVDDSDEIIVNFLRDVETSNNKIVFSR
jgi:hypothetical protein